ncbi:MAG: YjjW family glycine radical enzyme activase [Alphaproteobacteria bacterium]
MNLRLARISKILPWSCVDGPGNRMVLFLQGCNFACAACHNPHTIGQCNDCGDCLPACPTGALTLVAGRMVFDPALCTQCDACLRACPISASPMALPYGVADILAQLHQNRAFLSGITVSGGEPTLQGGFIRALFAAIHADPALAGLTCFIDSNGNLGAQGWAALLPQTDGVMLDIKAFDPALHFAMTGRSNARSLASARIAHAAGKLHELRFLLVPGQTDTDAEINHLIRFCQDLGAPLRLRLNAFHPQGTAGAAADAPSMSQARTEALAEQLCSAGLGPVILPTVWL